MDPSWRLCFPALPKGELRKSWFHVSEAEDADRTFPVHAGPALVYIVSAATSRIYIFFIESILFISCLQRFTLRLNSGALTMADESKLYPSYEHPLPIFSLFGGDTQHRGVEKWGGGCFTVPWKRISCQCLTRVLKKNNYKLVASMKKKKKKKKHFVCAKCQLFLLIGINRGELLCVTIQVNSFLGKCFLFFSRPNGISRASATPAVTVLSTSHLSSGPLMWLTRVFPVVQMVLEGG